MDSLWARPGTSQRTGPSGPSLLAAVALTIALLLAALIAGGGGPGAWWTRADSRPIEERITYVAPPIARPAVVPPPPTTRAAPTRSGAPAGNPAATPRAVPMSPATPFVPTAPGTGVSLDTGNARGTGATRATPGAANPAATGAGAGTIPALRGPTLFPMPLRVGAELPQGAPLTNERRDSILKAWRDGLPGSAAVAKAIAENAGAQARAADADRRHGPPTSGPSIKLGVSIPLFGGPSDAQRKRDAAVDAEVRGRLAGVTDRVRQRADSIRVDSVRRDSVRRATVQP